MMAEIIEPAGSNNVTQSKIAVLGILFLITGILGLPLLWVNKRFSTFERICWSLVLLAYTIALIGVTIAVLSWLYRFIVGV